MSPKPTRCKNRNAKAQRDLQQNKIFFLIPDPPRGFEPEFRAKTRSAHGKGRGASFVACAFAEDAALFDIRIVNASGSPRPPQESRPVPGPESVSGNVRKCPDIARFVFINRSLCSAFSQNRKHPAKMSGHLVTLRRGRQEMSRNVAVFTF